MKPPPPPAFGLFPPIWLSSPATTAAVAAPAARLSGNGKLEIALITALTPSTPASTTEAPVRITLLATLVPVLVVSDIISLISIASRVTCKIFSVAAKAL